MFNPLPGLLFLEFIKQRSSNHVIFALIIQNFIEMKKFVNYFLTLVASAVLLSACNGDGNKDENEIKSPIVGTWNVPALEINDNEEFVDGCMFCIWEAPEDTKLWVLPINELSPLIEQLGSAILPNMLKDVTFLKNGNITATYSESELDLENPNPVWTKLPEGYASFEIVNDHEMLLHLNMDKINEDLETRAGEDSGNMFENGIPLNYSVSSDESELKLYIDKPFMDKVAKIAPILAGLITEEAFGDMAALVKAILEDLPNAMDKTTKFECGLRLTR